MSKEILIFIHSLHDTPGYVTDILQGKNIPYRLIHSYNNESIPPLDDSVAGLIFLGGSMSVNDGISWLEQETELIRQAINVGLPVIGHCLGGQLISKALGQKVSKNLNVEIGWHDCYRTNNQTSNDWLGELSNPFTMFHWHDETFGIPPDAIPLFNSKYCENQAYSYGDNVLAMQCHVEMTEELLTLWLDKYPEELSKESQSEQTHQQIRAKLSENIFELNKVAEQLYSRWFKTLAL